MEHNTTITGARTVQSSDPETAATVRPRAGRWLRGMVRFVIASTLLMVGAMVALTGAITVIGLPLGLIVIGVGLELMRPATGRNANTPR
ncbi:MAG TPA: hypothetical protein VE915_04420 [Actinomycetota bacterium]|nr:hypothetical protein [Actinomycetota bacterium]